MKVGILAGGVGSRLSEETVLKPKPMVEIGGHPILWHIMMYYSHFGFNEFVIALGYKGEYIKKYMADYCSLASDLTIDLAQWCCHAALESSPQLAYRRRGHWPADPDGGRIKRLKPYLGSGTFMLTWGDGVSTVDLRELLAFHQAHGRLATVTAVRPPARFGGLEIEADGVVSFGKKPQMSEGWINGAFFVLEPGVFDLIDGDLTQFEREPLETLARGGQLMAYRHAGFWQCMDTLRDKVRLEEIWATGNAPWKVWN